jgi:xanthine dehydrogenase accessory factor
MFDDIIERAFEYLEANEDLELVEIVESSNSGTPRKAGAFMFVDVNAESFGTVGGGNVEYQATLYAKDLLLKKIDGEKKYELSQAAAESIGMVCGGDNLMKFTYLTNDEKSKKILSELKEKNKSKNTVFIFGGGHVSMELAKTLKYVGFEYVVWDDRSNFANRERFPDAKEVICEPFDNILDKIKVTNQDMIVVMTRGHVYDYIVEKQALKTDAAYIGVIGSSSKNKVIREKLLVDGYSENEINRVCAPIGIPIAADTPEEIAISIAAEIIMFRSRLEGRRKIMENNPLLNIYKGKLGS